MVAAAVVSAVDQHVAHAGRAHLAEGDFLRVGHHGRVASFRRDAAPAADQQHRTGARSAGPMHRTYGRRRVG
jgi:hypothetical protein